MRFEKLDLRNLESHVVEGIAGRTFMPPSLIPEDEPLPAITLAPPPPPVFSEADLKQSEQEGYRRGFLEGTREGQMQARSEQSDIDQQLAGMVEQMATRLQEMMSAYNAFAAEQKQYMPQLALSIARKVAGEALAKNPLPLIEATVIPCIERVIGVPRITVTVNSALAPTLEKRLGAHFANNKEPGEVSVLGDPALAKGDCRIDWASGLAERNTAALWQEVESIINDMIVTGRGNAPAAPALPLPAPVAAAAPQHYDAAQEESFMASSPPDSEAAASLREAIGDEPLIDPELLKQLNETPNQGE